MFVEKLSDILPEIDAVLLQNFEKDISAYFNPMAQKTNTTPSKARVYQGKIKKKYDKKELDKIKKEYAKLTFHPTCFYATDTNTIPLPWQLVQVNIQENGSDHFLGRIHNIFNKLIPKPKPPKASP